MKKIVCMLLSLLLPLTAMAAPIRDMRESVLSDAELNTMRAWLDTTVRESLPVVYEDDVYVGAHVYSCVEDGGCYILECDVYLEAGDDAMPGDAEEDALQWICGVTAAVQREGSGYEMLSCDITPYFTAESYHTVYNSAYGFQINLPDCFTARKDGYDYSCYEENELVAGVTFRSETAEDADLIAYAAMLTGETDDGMIVTVKPEIGMATARAAGLYIAVYVGDGVFYSLTVTYPEDREAEFTLYAEFMRNSLIMDGESNG